MSGLLGGLLLTLAQAASLTPTLSVRPATSNISIGERFLVTVTATGPRGTSWEFPSAVADSSTEMTLSRNPATSANTAIYDAQVFGIGPDVRVPEIKVQYKLESGQAGAIASAPVPLNIVSTIDPGDTNPAPADFAPPQRVLASRAFWVASTTASLLLIGALVLLARRARWPKKPADPTALPAVSPEEQALMALDQLDTSQATLKARAFYIQLTQILKRYLEIRLKAPVLEMTSTETLAFVKAHSWTSPHAPALRDLVSSADLVKFGGSSDALNAPQQIQLVRDLVGRIDRLQRATQTMPREPVGRRTA